MSNFEQERRLPRRSYPMTEPRGAGLPWLVVVIVALAAVALGLYAFSNREERSATAPSTAQSDLNTGAAGPREPERSDQIPTRPQGQPNDSAR
jgi:hypothetical protein